MIVARAGAADFLDEPFHALVLDRLLEELKGPQREILVLVDVEQISVPEASAVLGINLNTAYTRLRAARLSFQSAVDRLKATERVHEGGGPHE